MQKNTKYKIIQRLILLGSPQHNQNKGQGQKEWGGGEEGREGQGRGPKEEELKEEDELNIMDHQRVVRNYKSIAEKHSQRFQTM